jgi:peptidoglycan/xylan/chitin deacetylase (PgdA/CDA1 family)
MIKDKLKNIFFNISFLLGQDKKYLRMIKKNNHLVILNLHKISSEENPFYSPLSPKLFEELLKYVSKYFNIITFQQIEEYQNTSKPNMILSFDDGYYDFLEYAMPIMKKYHVSANLNIIPSYVENQEPMWNIKLYDFLNSSPIKLIKEMKIEGFSYKINERNKSQFGMLLGRHLKQMPREKREIYLKELETIFEKNSNVKYTRILNIKEIIEISQYHEVGVHSYFHESMGYESNEFFKEDFFKCQEYFSEKLKLPMSIYAFPNGSYRDTQLSFLEDNGIEHILLVNNKFARYNTNIYDRFTFYGDSINEVKLRALGFYR